VGIVVVAASSSSGTGSSFRTTGTTARHGGCRILVLGLTQNGRDHNDITNTSLFGDTIRIPAIYRIVICFYSCCCGGGCYY